MFVFVGSSVGFKLNGDPVKVGLLEDGFSVGLVVATAEGLTEDGRIVGSAEVEV